MAFSMTTLYEMERLLLPQYVDALEGAVSRVRRELKVPGVRLIVLEKA